MASIEQEWVQLRDAVSGLLAGGRHDEAVIYSKSFITRKRIALGQKGISTLVFKFAALLSDSNDGTAASGAFLEWFIDEGEFHVETHPRESVLFQWCDVEATTALLEEMPVGRRHSIVSKIYSPLHKSLARKRISSPQQQSQNESLHERLDKLEQTFANLFEESEDWLHAFEAVLRFKKPDILRAARILDKLSDESKTEKPLFFGRAVLKLVAQGHADKAATMLDASASYLNRDTASSASLAVFSLAAAIAPLAAGVAAEAAQQRPPTAQQQEAFVATAAPARAMLQGVDSKLVSGWFSRPPSPPLNHIIHPLFHPSLSPLIKPLIHPLIHSVPPPYSSLVSTHFVCLPLSSGSTRS